MSSTIVGRALAADGTVRWHHADGMAARVLLPVNLRHRQPRGTINVEHGDRTIGEVVHLSLSARGDLDLVGVVDEPPEEDARYLSIEALHDDGDDIEIRAVALTASPAALSLWPITVVWGLDVRQHVGGLPWGINDRVRSLLADAHREYRRRLPHIELERAGHADVERTHVEHRAALAEVPDRRSMGPVEVRPSIIIDVR